MEKKEIDLRNENKKKQDKPNASKNITSNTVTKNDKSINVDQLLFNLKTISEIRENDKLLSHQTNLEIDQRYFQNIRKWYYNENRDATLDKLNDIIENAFIYVESLYKKDSKSKIVDTSNSSKLQRIYLLLTNCTNGLDNLKLTYKDDLTIKTKINLIIEKIKIRNNELSKTFEIKI